MKKLLSIILALLLLVGLMPVSAFAEDDFEYEFKTDNIIYNYKSTATSESGNFILETYEVNQDGSTTPSTGWLGGGANKVVAITPTRNDIIAVA